MNDKRPWTTIHNEPQKDRPDKAKRLVDAVAEQAARYSWDAPDWSMLDDRRGELPDFPLKIFSPVIREWIKRSAHGAGVTPDHVVVPLLGIASGLIGTARRVRASSSWSEPCAMWLATIGFSRTGKTPGINVSKRALDYVEQNRDAEITKLRFEHEKRAEEAKAELKAWKQAVQEAVTARQPVPPKPIKAGDLGEFVSPRLYVSDTTIERLGVLLKARPRGMVLILDELAGLFANMSRYSGGQDNQFWLEAWNGARRPIDRMGRPSLIVPHLLIGVVGGFQPDKLNRSFRGDADGMYARFLFSWPQEPTYRELTEEALERDPELINAFERLRKLEEARSDQQEFAPKASPLSEGARKEFEDFRHFLHTHKQALDGRLREWWAKAPANVLRLAGTLALFEWAWAGGSEPENVDVAYLKSAVLAYREYFALHAEAALRQIGLSEQHGDLRRVLRWIRAKRLTEVSVQDVRRRALAHSVDADGASQLIHEMVSRCWLRPKPSEKEPHRPALRWAVNPLLYEDALDAESAGSAESQVGGRLPALPALPASPQRRRKVEGHQVTLEPNGGRHRCGGGICLQCAEADGKTIPNRHPKAHGLDIHRQCFRVWLQNGCQPHPTLRAQWEARAPARRQAAAGPGASTEVPNLPPAVATGTLG